MENPIKFFIFKFKAKRKLIFIKKLQAEAPIRQDNRIYRIIFDPILSIL